MTLASRLRLCCQILFGIPILGEGETTSPEVASLASRGLRTPWVLSNGDIKKLCASALTQARDRDGL
jgi:hypothetical protein